MKILVFEHICGGGLADQPLPASLAAEGNMMLQALIEDLKCLANIELLVPLDQRCPIPNGLSESETLTITANQDVIRLLPTLLADCDAIWPIAPETDGLLAEIANITQTAQKILLLSKPEAVAICTDKLATFQALSAKHIAVADTVLLCDADSAYAGWRVIKPRDGVGCQGGFIVKNPAEFQRVLTNQTDNNQLIVQPYYTGTAVSLSCLLRDGQGWLLCHNQQEIEEVNGYFNLTACLVNQTSSYMAYYRDLVQQIATAIPGLWGYIGIDLIETTQQNPLVLEINPRLTTSYAGIREATGINIAEQVLASLNAEPVIKPTKDIQVRVAIT